MSSFPSPWDKPPPIPTVITPSDKRMSPSQQQRDLSLQTHAHIRSAVFHIFTDGLVQGGIEDGGARLVVLSQDDPLHEWHAPVGTCSSSFQAFHHGPQQSSSVTANHWFKLSATLNQLICLSFNYRLQWQYSLCQNSSWLCGSWSRRPYR